MITESDSEVWMTGGGGGETVPLVSALVLLCSVGNIVLFLQVAVVAGAMTSCLLAAGVARQN